MAYDTTGNWKPENQTTAANVAALQTQDSPLMRNAAASGVRAANRRGLGNSSIAIGASQAATLGAVTPIGSQDAKQTFDKNYQATDHSQQTRVVGTQVAAQDRANYAQSLTSAGNTYTTGIGNTLQNDKIPVATRSAAQADIAGLYRSQQQQLGALYGVTLNWGGG